MLETFRGGYGIPYSGVISHASMDLYSNRFLV